MRIARRKIGLLLLLCLVYSGLHMNLASPMATKNKFTMSDQDKQFTRPWIERRGIESTDRNAEVILVRVPLDKLSDALTERAVESKRNVLNSEIFVQGSFLFAYQMTGHTWSIVVSGQLTESTLSSQINLLKSSQLAHLSKQLGQPIIRLIVSDTAGVVGYDLFEDGELVEYFAGCEGESCSDLNEYSLQTQKYFLFPYPEDTEAIQTAYFWSLRRQIKAEEIGDIWKFADCFLQEYDAFDPAIDSRYLLGTDLVKLGNRYRIQNQGFTTFTTSGKEIRSIPTLMRVDYFRLGK